MFEFFYVDFKCFLDKIVYFQSLHGQILRQGWGEFGRQGLLD